MQISKPTITFAKIQNKMLQINFIRQNVDFVKERLSVKNFSDLSLVDKVVELDEQVRKLKGESETLQARMNTASKEIGMLMGKGDKDAAEKKKQDVAQEKINIQQLSEQLSAVEKMLHDEIVKLPNLPHSSVPKGKTHEELRSS